MLLMTLGLSLLSDDQLIHNLILLHRCLQYKMVGKSHCFPVCFSQAVAQVASLLSCWPVLHSSKAPYTLR